MANTIKLKRGTSTPSTSDIASGEVAVDTSAQKLYINDSGTVKEIGGGGGGGGDTGIDFNNNVKVQWGDTSGGYLEIYNSGSDSIIKSVTDDLWIYAHDNIILAGATSGDKYFRTVDNAGVFLYYDNSITAETVSAGFTVTGTCTADTITGSSGNHTLTSSGTNSTLSLNSTGTNSKVKLKASGSNGSIQMTAVSDIKFYSGTDFQTQTFEAKSGGVDVYGNCLIRSGGELRLGDDDNSNRVGFKAPSTVSSDQIWTLPAADGSANTSLTTDGSGNLSWASATDSTKLPLAGGTMTGNLLFGDQVEARFGASADLAIEHDGGNSFITESGTGKLIIKSNNQIELVSSSNESMIEAIVDGATKFYYDNSLKLATTSGGVAIDGDLKLANQSIDNALNWGKVSSILQARDSTKITFGNANDLQIYHTGSLSYIQDTGTGHLVLSGSKVQMTNAADSEGMFMATENGSVDLYYDNSKKAESTSSGFAITGVLSSNQTSGQAISIGDNAQINLGNGDDLVLYHDGSNSYLKNTTGRLDVSSTSYLYLESDDRVYIGNVGMTEVGAIFVKDGAMILNYDNSTKFETTSDGPAISSQGADNSRLYFLTSGHTTTRIGYVGLNQFGMDVNGGVQIRDAGNSYETMFKTISNGAVELYYDGVKQINTTSTGVTLGDNKRIDLGDGADFRLYHDGSANRIVGTGAHDIEVYTSNTKRFTIGSNGNTVFLDDVKVFFGTGSDLRIYHDGSHSYIKDSGTGNLRIDGSDNVELQAGGSTKAYTYANGLFVYNQQIPDNGVLNIGNGSDLQLKHTGSNSLIKHQGAGNVYMDSYNAHIYIRAGDGNTSVDNSIFCSNAAHVSLYYDGSQKFYTQSDKCVVAGHFYPESNNSYDLGHSSYRWANLYVNDMHFSNEGKSNSVDGTWGDWTLQEGDENIFMINNRTGKKYRMGLQEVN